MSNYFVSTYQMIIHSRSYEQFYSREDVNHDNKPKSAKIHNRAKTPGRLLKSRRVTLFPEIFSAGLDE